MVQWHIWLLKSSQQRCILTQILKFYDKISCCFFPCQTKHSKIWHCKACCRRWLCRNSLTEVCVLVKNIHSEFTSFKTKASDLFIYLFISSVLWALEDLSWPLWATAEAELWAVEKASLFVPLWCGKPMGAGLQELLKQVMSWACDGDPCSLDSPLYRWLLWAVWGRGRVYNTHGAAGGHTECLLIGDNCRGPLGHRHQAVLVLMVLWSSDGWCLRARGTASLLAKCVSRIGMEGFGYMHIKIPVTQLCYPYR